MAGEPGKAWDLSRKQWERKAYGSSPSPVVYVKRTQAALSIRWKRIGSVKGMEVGTSSWRIISDGVDVYAR